MNYGFVEISGNSKTGPIPVTITSKKSCPNSCPLKDSSCYARVGRLNIHWDRVTKSGLSLSELTEKINSIRPNRLWRHNQAGDLAKNGNGEIDSKALEAITLANKGKRGFTYTHCDPWKANNGEAIKKANDNGFTVNLSANTLEHADKLVDGNFGPVVTLLPAEVKENFVTPKGRKVVVCPAYTHNVQCMDCALCQKAKRSVIVGFPAHGICKKRAEDIFNS